MLQHHFFQLLLTGLIETYHNSLKQQSVFSRHKVLHVSGDAWIWWKWCVVVPVYVLQLS